MYLKEYINNIKTDKSFFENKSWLNREKLIEHFEEKKIPTSASEEWKNFRTTKLNKINWEVPSGYIKSKKIGTSNFGGLTVTAGEIIISAGTNDKKIIAIDSNNGEELWSYQMIAAGSTAPITFELNQKQYIAVVSTGGRYHNYSKKYGELYVFRLDMD